ncbi:ArsC family reductase [Corticibacter populi]|uniref:ArsC family reductase n=1 Tax=Corticibacter populi TaxID=1550736 RepID=A0A3M6QHP4_9BURK|nr:ArsC family reductase [Corticibacter populi]RMX02630.1 ArsC family reductase [Corticibacter populi]RZS32953.1 Spx/MgsR family transcriptional regulator [Corticibacter populi]
MSTAPSSTAAVHVYGIPNCDTVKKSRQWLVEQGVEPVFHDFKKQGLDAATLRQWVGALGWEALLNRRGTTWRKLDAATQASVVDAASAEAVMLEHLSLIKRPVVRWARAGQAPQWTVGYVPEVWQRLHEVA